MLRLLAPRLLALPLLGLALLAPAVGHSAELRVLTSGAYRAVLVQLAPLIEQEMGHHLVIQNETAGAAAQRVREEERVDLVVLPPANAAALGPLLGPGRPLARVGIGAAVKTGTAKPDLSTAAAVRVAVLAARAPAWIDPASGGSSGIYLSSLWAQWGIAGQLAPRAVLVRGGLVADKLRSGDADLAFQQLSELVGGGGIDVVGPLPAAIQNWTVYAGAVPARSAQAPAANQVLVFLAGPRAQAALPALGMEAP